jgi:hypothetical protein
VHPAVVADAPRPDQRHRAWVQGLDTLEEVAARGRAHFVEMFADREGFTRDFVSYLDDLGLSWETAPSAERLQCPPDEMEIGVGSMAVIDKLGATTFAEVFTHPREVVQAAMAERHGLLGELDELLRRHQIAW